MATKVTPSMKLFLYFGVLIHLAYAVPERGIKEMVFNRNSEYKSFAKSLFKDAKITISGEVDHTKQNGELADLEAFSLNWYLLQSECAQYFIHIQENSLQDGVLLQLVNEDQSARNLYTMYSQGVLNVEHGHLRKTELTLERKISKEDKVHTSEQTTVATNVSIAAAKISSLDEQSTSLTQDHPRHDTKKTVTHSSKRKETLDKHTGTKNFKFQKRRQHVNKHTGTKTSKKLPHDRSNRAIMKREAAKKQPQTPVPTVETSTTTTTTSTQMRGGVDGNYLLVISAQELPNDVSVKVKISIKMNTGYLSAAEWPLLPFYGAMSLVYLAYGVVWLIVSACQWRDLLRIQFWIGGVIALGMLEKAILFSEYNSVNDTGVPAHGLVVLSLVLSCIKRTLSRILIIIVSMGFGIVKPRLGGALHRVLGVGCLYFILSMIEGSFRENSVKADVSRKQMIASVPLSVLDAVICWWIFMSLLQTMRTLRIRKNLVKLSLYRHFTNILVVSVIASVAFMVWVIKAHSFNNCIQDWKEIWIDDAFWHFLFALILLAIMVLWRPTANNQRYAFTPLIDVGEDDDDDMTLSDAFTGMKMRGKAEAEVPNRADKQRKKAEDDLKWVEENIPTSGGIDTALPSLLDSDEEMMTTKLEMSKME